MSLFIGLLVGLLLIWLLQLLWLLDGVLKETTMYPLYRRCLTVSLICALLFALTQLTGCATRPVWLENRVACTLDRKELHALSKWGPFSIGSVISASDAEVACKS